MRREKKASKLISVDTLGIITYQIWMIIIMSLLYQFIILFSFVFVIFFFCLGFTQPSRDMYVRLFVLCASV